MEKTRRMQAITIYHNPRCSKSRQTLAILREQGHEPQIVEYLKDPPDPTTLLGIVDKLGIHPSELIRQKEYRKLGLSESNNPHELVIRMSQNPEIIQRPIVVNGNTARIGRPPENVIDIL